MVFILHAFLISCKILKDNSVDKNPKRVRQTNMTRVVLQKPMLKPQKKIKKPPKYVPSFSSLPVDFEVYEEEVEPEEEYIEEICIDDYIVDLIEPSPVISEEELNSIRKSYINQIYYAVEEVKYYPKMAKRMNQEGTVEIAFTLLKDGTIMDVKLEKTSGFYSIDQAALDAVKKIKKIEPIPQELNKEKWELILPIKFELS